MFLGGKVEEIIGFVLSTTKSKGGHFKGDNRSLMKRVTAAVSLLQRVQRQFNKFLSPHS